MSSNQLIHAMLSHQGLVRRGNEDTCDVCVQAGAFVVCDGMGGAAAGEVASHLAAAAFLDDLRQSASNGNHATPEARLAAAVRAANQVVYRHSRQSSKFSGMGTTLVALLAPIADGQTNGHATDDTFWLANVGDSRCYRLRDGHLQQLTHDHSFVEEQLRAGQITHAQAAHSPLRNLITRAIGSRSCVEPEIHSDHLQPGDLYLLASDGLTHDVVDSEIESILTAIPASATQSDLAQACQALVAAANRNGGHDNITVLLTALASA